MCVCFARKEERRREKGEHGKGEERGEDDAGRKGTRVKQERTKGGAREIKNRTRNRFKNRLPELEEESERGKLG